MESKIAISGVVEAILSDASTGREQWRSGRRNLVVNTGLAWIATVVANADTGSWYIELGTGTTAASAGQTALVTPDASTWRLVSGLSASSSSATLATIYPAASANGTWAEVALFGGSTSTAGSGSMVARALSTITKTSSQVLTVNWTLTFTA